MGRSQTGRTGARFGAPARRAGHAPDPEQPHGEPPGEPDPGAAPPRDETVGLTGARFGGRTRTPRTRAGKAAPKDARKATRTAAARAAATEQDGPASPSPDLPPWTEQTPAPQPDRGRAWETTPMPRVVEALEPVSTIRSVRPYVVTGGRTRARVDLRVETLVSSTADPDGEAGDDLDEELGERGTVLQMCTLPRSVSEVAAVIGVPLGVARVVIGDLAAEGRLRVHAGVDAADGPDLALLDRVLSGLRRL